MLLIILLFVLGVGLLQLLKPDMWWTITQSWKSSYADEPSDFYRKITRIGGAICTAVGAVGTVLFFVFLD